jgi:hypothetical protein
MFYVERRDAPTLFQIIKDNVYEKTTIAFYCWPAYRGIAHLGYQHEENYICLITGTNTQRIECEWGHAKLLIMKRRKGTASELIQSHLDEYSFFKNTGMKHYYLVEKL